MDSHSYSEWNPKQIGWGGFIKKLYAHHKPDGGALILRIGLALIFVYEGWSKVSNLGGTIKFLGMIGFSGPAGWAVLLGCVELVGGLLILFGILTKPACVALAVDMAVVIFGVHMGKGGGGYLWGHMYESFLLMSLLAMYIMGPGKYSLAHLWLKRRHHPST